MNKRETIKEHAGSPRKVRKMRKQHATHKKGFILPRGGQSLRQLLEVKTIVGDSEKKQKRSK